MLSRYFPLCLGLAGVLMTHSAFASISLSSTRIIFDGAHKEANVTVRNGGQTILAQSWLDAGDAAGSAPPFAVTPPLARLEPNQQQLLRILYEGRGMPADKESVVWLNVQEIPQASAADVNTLQLAVRQRIKVFFRPDGLTGDAAQAPVQLVWQLVTQAGKSVLKVKNQSNYHVSLADLKIAAGNKAELVIDSTMIGPGEVRSFNLKELPPGSPRLTFSAINDYGAQQRFDAPLSATESHAERVKDASAQ
ncbi:putative fimbrial chaperone YadV [Pseudomonas fluorescens]|uniref:Putative fimbrial chaperone YadV n=1 Tax=Pseudomonas fluorescens TaxID=294 RepID=A0A5E7SIL6_PSEFL|nr:molecular chaperone [Pseudomonas fluorescens]VVP86602.1 putative fimbrial chaperone YadV [Pseudomonas fluorescens]